MTLCLPCRNSIRWNRPRNAVGSTAANLWPCSRRWPLVQKSISYSFAWQIATTSPPRISRTSWNANRRCVVDPLNIWWQLFFSSCSINCSVLGALDKYPVNCNIYRMCLVQPGTVRTYQAHSLTSSGNRWLTWILVCYLFLDWMAIYPFHLSLLLLLLLLLLLFILLQ